MYPNSYFRPSLLSRGLGVTKSINWGSLLDGTQKTLGVINQAIPIVYQIKPMFSNAKTMFRIADEIRSPSAPVKKVTNDETVSVDTNRPVFYI